jgi:hypothetical protein
MVVPVKGIQCGNCRHVLRDGPPPRCKAFPEEIPDAILSGIHDHRSPFPGDHGIRFEPSEDFRESEDNIR